MSMKAPLAADIAMGKRIRTLRMTAHMSQERLAEACGISFQQVQKYEKGTNRVGYSRLEQISGALGVSVSQLLPPAEERTPQSAVVDLIGAGANVGDVDAIKLYLALPAGARRTVQGAIEALHTAHFPHAEAAE